MTPSDALYAAREATADRKAAQDREADAWDTYHAIRAAWLPPDVALATDPAPAHVEAPGRRVVQPRKTHPHP